MNVGVRELKAKLSHYLDLAEAGVEVVVTEHGRAVARLVGLPAQLPAPLVEMARRGELHRATHPRAALEAATPAPASGSLVDVLIEERQHEYDRLP
ncbi:MAG: hypothetical protein NVSMB17_14500 [Candidatus Dormibacteria bacterium]